MDTDGPLAYTVDASNILPRPLKCRLPLARHHRTHNIATLVDSDGRPLGSQIAHLRGIQRVDAEIIRGLAGRGNEKEGGVVGKVTLPLAPTDPDVSTPAPVDDDDDAGGPPRHQVPGTSQWIILLDDMLGAGEGWHVTGEESLDGILPPYSDGETHRSVIISGRLLQLYRWMHARGDEISEQTVVNLVMSRYVGTEPGRRDEIARMVRSDLTRGRHLERTGRTTRARAMAISAATAAEGAGMENPTTVRVLQGICCKANAAGVATTTAQELARMIGLIAVDETDGRTVRNAERVIGYHIRILMDTGLLERSATGRSAGTPSVYRLMWLDPAGDRGDGA